MPASQHLKSWAGCRMLLTALCPLCWCVCSPGPNGFLTSLRLWDSILTFFSVSKPPAKSNLHDKGFICLTISGYDLLQKSHRGRNTRTHEPRAMKAYTYTSVHPFPFLQSWESFGNDAIHRGWVLPSSMKIMQTHPQVNPLQTSFPVDSGWHQVDNYLTTEDGKVRLHILKISFSKTRNAKLLLSFYLLYPVHQPFSWVLIFCLSGCHVSHLNSSVSRQEPPQEVPISILVEPKGSVSVCGLEVQRGYMYKHKNNCVIHKNASQPLKVIMGCAQWAHGPASLTSGIRTLCVLVMPCGGLTIPVVSRRKEAHFIFTWGGRLEYVGIDDFEVFQDELCPLKVLC